VIDANEQSGEAAQSNVAQAPPATRPESQSSPIETDDLDRVKEPGLHIVFDSVQERSSASDDQSVSVEYVCTSKLVPRVYSTN